MLRRVLTQRQEELLTEEREWLLRLRLPLADLEAAPADLALLDRALQQLEDFFLLVVVGEFNSGKSAFINALLGARFLEEGVTPTTSAIHILRYGDAPGFSPAADDVINAAYPAEWLRELHIVDTPGTNAVIQKHQQITEDFIPRADLVLFVTSADRPFSESERLFLQRVREWGKKIVVVVNKVDILDGQEDMDRVLAFVEANARDILGRTPIVFAVASRLARQAKEAKDPNERARLWSASRFEALEGYILKTLDERERLRLKLANPLGVAQNLLTRYLAVAENRGILLIEDVATVKTIHSQLQAYDADMRRDFKYHLSHVDNVLYAMSDRGNRFFDDTIRLQRLFDLLNADRIRGMFEREVVADTSARVASQTRDLIDWLVDQDFRQWQGVMEYLQKRLARHEDRIIGQVGGRFESNRQSLLESVGRASREVVSTYDHEREARELADSVQRAVAQTAIVEAGAVGLGALLVKLLATTVADVSGILAAGALATLGLYVIPHRRQRAKQNLNTKISELRDRLSTALTGQFDGELTRSLSRINDAMRPYTRFVENQQSTLAATEHSLRSVQSALSGIAERIEKEI